MHFASSNDNNYFVVLHNFFLQLEPSGIFGINGKRTSIAINTLVVNLGLYDLLTIRMGITTTPPPLENMFGKMLPRSRVRVDIITNMTH